MLLVAGLDGIENKRDPGPRLDIDMYAEGHTVKDAKRLPLNLLDALRALQGSSVLTAPVSASRSSPPTPSSRAPTGTTTPVI